MSDTLHDIPPDNSLALDLLLLLGGVQMGSAGISARFSPTSTKLQCRHQRVFSS